MKDIILFFLKHLSLGEKMMDKIEINFIDSKNGSIVKDDNKYYIELPKKESKVMQIYALAHELVHVKQFEKRELFDLGNNRLKFKGKLYKLTEKTYWNLPYEKEARELGWELLDLAEIQFGSF